MFRSLLRVFCLVLLALAGPLNAFAQPRVDNPSVSMSLEWQIGSWRTLWKTAEFESAVVGQPVGYYVYLPPNYEVETDRRYPVVIWLHGAYGRPHEASAVIRRLDRQIRAGKTQPMIVISALDPTGLGMWTDSKDGRLPMETLIIEELIPHVDGAYRTKATRDKRAIEGFSMGGYGAAYLGFKYRDVFSSVSMLAAALHTPETFAERRRAIFDNVFGGDGDYAAARSPWGLLKEHANDIGARTKVRIFVGADDQLLEWNRNFHDAMIALGVSHEWGVVPNSPHDVSVLMQNWQGDFFAYYEDAFGD